jgi:hypothetical protein
VSLNIVCVCPRRCKSSLTSTSTAILGRSSTHIVDPWGFRSVVLSFTTSTASSWSRTFSSGEIPRLCVYASPAAEVHPEWRLCMYYYHLHFSFVCILYIYILNFSSLLDYGNSCDVITLFVQWYVINIELKWNTEHQVTSLLTINESSQLYLEVLGIFWKFQIALAVILVSALKIYVWRFYKYWLFNMWCSVLWHHVVWYVVTKVSLFPPLSGCYDDV